MKILNFSLEKKLFESASKSQKRVLDYSQLFDRFDLIVLTEKKFRPLSFPGMEIAPTNSLGKLFYLMDAWRLGKKMVKKYGSDVISVQDPFEIGFAGWRLAKKFGLKFQVQLHGDFFGSKWWRKENFLNHFRYFLGKFILKRADGVRVVSERIKKNLLEIGIPEEKISVVPIYAEIAESERGIDQKQEGKIIFLTVGRLVRVKNIEMQIDALVEINKKYPHSEFWIVGEGPGEKNLKIRAEKLKINQKIKFVGGWPPNLNDIYSQADVFLLTSNYEGWGLVVVEAASHGLPIIMTDVGCAGELIRNEESGIVIPVGGKKELIEAMEKIILNRDFAEALGKKARETVLALPDREQNLKMYKDSFKF